MALKRPRHINPGKMCAKDQLIPSGRLGNDCLRSMLPVVVDDPAYNVVTVDTIDIAIHPFYAVPFPGLGETTYPIVHFAPLNAPLIVFPCYGKQRSTQLPTAALPSTGKALR
jgi:hypothetical protein